MLKAILIDDEPIASEILEILLEPIDEVEVVGKYLSISDAWNDQNNVQPDLIFLDIEMPGTDGLTGSALLKERFPDAKIVYVTAYPEYADAVRRPGVVGYLLKPVVPSLLEELVRQEAKRQR